MMEGEPVRLPSLQGRSRFEDFLNLEKVYFFLMKSRGALHTNGSNY